MFFFFRSFGGFQGVVERRTTLHKFLIGFMFYVELSCCVCMWHDKRLVASSINLLFFALCRWQGNSLLDPEKAETLLAFASWVRLFFLESISRVEQSLTIVSWLAGWAVQFLFSSFRLFFIFFLSFCFAKFLRLF